jgi:hypothetical protein
MATRTQSAQAALEALPAPTGEHAKQFGPMWGFTKQTPFPVHTQLTLNLAHHNQYDAQANHKATMDGYGKLDRKLLALDYAPRAQAVEVGKREKVAMSSLRAIQPGVRGDHVANMVGGVSSHFGSQIAQYLPKSVGSALGLSNEGLRRGTTRPVVLRVGAENLVIDGHHRATRDALVGLGSTRVHQFDAKKIDPLEAEKSRMMHRVVDERWNRGRKLNRVQKAIEGARTAPSGRRHLDRLIKNRLAMPTRAERQQLQRPSLSRMVLNPSRAVADLQAQAAQRASGLSAQAGQARVKAEKLRFEGILPPRAQELLHHAGRSEAVASRMVSPDGAAKYRALVDQARKTAAIRGGGAVAAVGLAALATSWVVNGVVHNRSQARMAELESARGRNGN